MHEKFQRLFQNVLLSCMSILLLLGILEIGIRFLMPQGDFFYQPDARLGARLVPSTDGKWTTPETTASIRINQEGYRGWEAEKDKEDGVTRIAILGDSYIEAFQVDEEKMLGTQLERLLNESDTEHRYEVLSFGVSGYGTNQEYLMFEEDVEDYDPDIVILAFNGGNDVRNNILSLEQKSDRPYFVFENKTLVEVSPIISASLVKDINRFFLTHSHLYRFALERYSRARLRFSPSSGAVPPVDYGIYACEETPQWQEAWRITDAVLKRFHERTLQQQRTFIVVNLSSYLQIHGRDALDDVKDLYPSMKEGCWDLEKPQQRIKEITQKTNISFLDLLPLFQEDYQKNSKEAHLVSDGHWSAYGQEQAAIMIGDYLTNNILTQ